jgi:hypothetical protein
MSLASLENVSMTLHLLQVLLRFILALLLGYGEKLSELLELHFWYTELK